MKKVFAAWAYVFLAASAYGQTCPTTTIVPYAPLTKAEAPAPFGDIAQLHFAWSAGGIALWRYSAAGDLYINAIPPSSLTLSEITSAAIDFGGALITGSLADFNAAYDKHRTRDMNDPDMRAVWCPLYAQMVAGMPKAPPAPVAYVVATNGTTLTRPTYLADQATLTVNISKALTYRAPVGAACIGPAFKSGTSSTIYMAYNGGPDYKTVTACAVKK